MSITLRSSADGDPLPDLIKRLEGEIKILRDRLRPEEEHIAYNQSIIDRLKAAAVLTAKHRQGNTKL